MIELRLTAGRLKIHVSWGQQKAAAGRDNVAYPMRVQAPVGFRPRRAARPFSQHTNDKE